MAGASKGRLSIVQFLSITSAPLPLIGHIVIVMSELEDFAADERDTVFGHEVVTFAAMVARLTARNPGVPLWRIQMLVRNEHDALITGISGFVLPGVLEGVQETLDRDSRTAGEEPAQ